LGGSELGKFCIMLQSLDQNLGDHISSKVDHAVLCLLQCFHLPLACLALSNIWLVIGRHCGSKFLKIFLIEPKLCNFLQQSVDISLLVRDLNVAASDDDCAAINDRLELEISRGRSGRASIGSRM
jgi:hypothetical protein